MKNYELKLMDTKKVEIYMPPSTDLIPDLDYSRSAGDWALRYPSKSKARRILSAAEGLAKTTCSEYEYELDLTQRHFFTFKFKNAGKRNIFLALIKDYLGGKDN